MVKRNVDQITKMFIVYKSAVLFTFDSSESFLDLFLVLISLFFVCKIVYPLGHEKTLGFFDESLQLSKDGVFFESKRNNVYLNLLNTTLEGLKSKTKH